MTLSTLLEKADTMHSENPELDAFDICKALLEDMHPRDLAELYTNNWVEFHFTPTFTQFNPPTLPANAIKNAVAELIDEHLDMSKND